MQWPIAAVAESTRGCSKATAGGMALADSPCILSSLETPQALKKAAIAITTPFLSGRASLPVM